MSYFCIKEILRVAEQNIWLMGQYQYWISGFLFLFLRRSYNWAYASNSLFFAPFKPGWNLRFVLRFALVLNPGQSLLSGVSMMGKKVIPSFLKPCKHD